MDGNRLPAAPGLDMISCPSTSLCVAATSNGNVVTSTRPTAAAAAWATTPSIDQDGLQAISCPASSLCVAADGFGRVVIGTRAPTTAQIKALLRTQLTPPPGKSRKLPALLLSHGYTFPASALTAGRLVISWYHDPVSSRRAIRKPRPVLIATGWASFAGAGAANLTIKPTRTGRQILKHFTQLRVTAWGAFTPAGKRAITAVKSFTARSAHSALTA